MKILVLFSILFVFASVTAKAWDDAGHKTIAYIAWNQMSPEVRERAFKILMSAPEDSDLSVFYLQDSRSADVKKRELFMIAATWADIIRDRKFKERYEKYHHSNWHYADTFWTVEKGQVKILPNPSGDDEGGKAVEKLIEFDKELKDAAVSDEEKAIALAWILHLGGDIHQPLHTSARVTELEPKGDQGGNLFLLTPKDEKPSENLHWFWDSILGRVFARNDMPDTEYIPLIGDMIMSKYPPTEMQNRLTVGNFGEWQKGSFALATTEVFTPDLIRYETPAAKYRRNAFQVSEQQMALAGYRLGAMLNQIFSGQNNNTSEITRQFFDENINSYKKQVSESQSKIGTGENDLWLWVKTRAGLIKTSELRDSTINVDVENSIVTLKGFLSNENQREFAVKAVKQIDGVKAVKDFLKVSK
ncbi:MAG: S1/P1 nuclease [Pyrinomonadaceae bacterium]